MSIEENINRIKGEIPENIKLIAVSKTKPLENLEEAYKAGIRDFGENKVQEFLDKFENFHSDVNWHFIGHLQRNKVKYIVGKVYLIHSLDNENLLNELEKRFSSKGEIANVLIQINIGRDANKSGVLLENLDTLLNACEKCNNVKVKGLMTVIPKGDDESNKKYFAQMKKIYDSLSKKRYNNIKMEYLSMGMSGDYKIAISQGANVIRIGQGIFGERVYKI